MAERLIAPVLKTGERESVPGVRIPLYPPTPLPDARPEHGIRSFEKRAVLKVTGRLAAAFAGAVLY
jgi:hypothetical protein